MNTHPPYSADNVLHGKESTIYTQITGDAPDDGKLAVRVGGTSATKLKAFQNAHGSLLHNAVGGSKGSSKLAFSQIKFGTSFDFSDASAMLESTVTNVDHAKEKIGKGHAFGVTARIDSLVETSFNFDKVNKTGNVTHHRRKAEGDMTMFFEEEVGRDKNVVEESGIPFIMFYGLALDGSVYSRLGAARSFSDLVKQVVRKPGYICVHVTES